MPTFEIAYQYPYTDTRRKKTYYVNITAKTASAARQQFYAKNVNAYYDIISVRKITTPVDKSTGKVLGRKFK